MPDLAAWAEPVVHPTYARLLCAVLRGRGLDAGEALAALGMTAAQLAKENGLLTFAQMRRLILKAVELTGSQSLGLELGPVAQAAAHGPVGSAAVASGDLAQALEVIARYGAERMAAVDFHLAVGQAVSLGKAAGRNYAVLSIRERFDFGDVRIFVLETILVTIASLLETIAGLPLDRAEYSLPYPAPAWADVYCRFVKGKVGFGASSMQIRLPRDLLEAACVTADVSAFASAQRECERALLEDGRLAQIVRRHLLGREGGYPSLADLARDLNVSPRTLIRKLKLDGASFQEILDGVRKERAEWYLRETPHPIEEIAARLGYADTTNFSRTCRRWFGATPGEIRRASSARR